VENGYSENHLIEHQF